MGSYEAFCFDEVVALYVATKEDDDEDEAPRGKHGAPRSILGILMGAGHKETDE